jgi:hypothetical protein
MWAKQLVFNDSCKGQAVKEVCEHLPYASAAILAQAFLIEPIHLLAAAPMDAQFISHTRPADSVEELHASIACSSFTPMQYIPLQEKKQQAIATELFRVTSNPEHHSKSTAVLSCLLCLPA